MHPSEELRGSKGSDLSGKKIILGVTGSIAAVECVKLVRELIREGAEVHCVMSDWGSKIIHPNSLEFASGNETITELTGQVEHVSHCGNVPDKADLFLVAPATANTISKMAKGIDDTPVTTFATTCVGSDIPIMVVPAMHQTMYNHPIVMDNLEELQEKLDVTVVGPKIEEGAAKVAEKDQIVDSVIRELHDDLKGERITVITGRTLEPIDSMRVITNRASGLKLEDGTVEKFDEVVMNSDFAWSMKNLISEEKREKYTNEKLDGMNYSCSTFMLYLGLDKELPQLEHHNVFIAEDYEKNFLEIESEKELSQDPSFYVHNASITDLSVAPEGHTALYVLVPVANLKGDIDWDAETERFRELVLDKLENRIGEEDIREHIVFEKKITPKDWREDYNVEYGATFNLGHNLGQMLVFRPRNDFEEFENMWLVGGGTSPGSGLPTIYESGRITANLIKKKYGLDYTFKHEEEIKRLSGKGPYS